MGLSCHWKVKVKALRLCTDRTAYRGSRGIALPFHDYGIRRGWEVSVTPRPFFTHCTEGWLGPRAGMDRCGESRLPPGFDPRTVQPVASRYTDWATRPTVTKKHLIFPNIWMPRPNVLVLTGTSHFPTAIRCTIYCSVSKALTDTYSFFILQSFDWLASFHLALLQAILFIAV